MHMQLQDILVEEIALSFVPKLMAASLANNYCDSVTCTCNTPVNVSDVNFVVINHFKVLGDFQLAVDGRKWVCGVIQMYNCSWPCRDHHYPWLSNDSPHCYKL